MNILHLIVHVTALMLDTLWGILVLVIVLTSTLIVAAIFAGMSEHDRKIMRDCFGPLPSKLKVAIVGFAITLFALIGYLAYNVKSV